MIKKYHVSKQLFDKTTVTNNSRVLYTTGEVGALAGCFVSDYIPVISGEKYTLNIADSSLTGVTGHLFALYNSSKIFVDTGTHACVAGQSIYSFTIPNGCAYIRFNSLERAKDSVMFVNGEYTTQTFPSYEPYGNTWNEVGYKKYETATDTFTTLPHEVIGDGQSNLTWSMDGNMQVNGTPTPQNPITPAETGEKTANLLDYKDITTTPNYATVTLITNGVNLTGKYMATIDMSLEINKSYYMSWTQQVVSGTADTGWRFKYTDNTYSNYGVNGGSLTPNKEVLQVLLYVTKSNDTASVDFTNIMFSVGNIPYEPFGYKIPISFGQGTYTSYLAEPIRALSTADEMASTGTTTRNIRKFVLTGQETISAYTNSAGKIGFSYERLDMVSNSRTDGLCTHFAPIQSISWTTTNSVCFGANNKTCYFIFSDDIATLYNLTDITSIKQWLADQYSAGTPVIFYYPLAAPTTESFTAPTIPTSGSPQSFDVDTTLKPSEVSLTWHGWHEHSDEKYVGGVNLFNKNTATLNTRVTSTGTTSYTGAFASDYISVGEGVECTITGLVTTIVTVIYFYDSNNTNVGYISADSQSSHTFTTPTGTAKLRFTGDMNYIDTASVIAKQWTP